MGNFLLFIVLRNQFLVSYTNSSDIFATWWCKPLIFQIWPFDFAVFIISISLQHKVSSQFLKFVDFGNGLLLSTLHINLMFIFSPTNFKNVNNFSEFSVAVDKISHETAQGWNKKYILKQTAKFNFFLKKNDLEFLLLI